MSTKAFKSLEHRNSDLSSPEFVALASASRDQGASVREKFLAACTGRTAAFGFFLST